MPKIIRFHETGGADVLQIEDLPFEQPGLLPDRAVRRTSVERIVY